MGSRAGYCLKEAPGMNINTGQSNLDNASHTHIARGAGHGPEIDESWASSAGHC